MKASMVPHVHVDAAGLMSILRRHAARRCRELRSGLRLSRLSERMTMMSDWSDQDQTTGGSANAMVPSASLTGS
jgi:hypothetical protein